MAESNLTASLIPFAAPENPGESVKNSSDDCVVEDVNPRVDIKVEYPDFTGNVIPLSGGAIISFEYSKEPVDVETISLFSSEINSILEIEESGDRLDLLTRIRNAVNSILKSIGRKDVVRKKTELPKIFISTYLGDDSEFINEVEKPIPGVIKVCEMSYIPLDVLKKIAENIASFVNLENVVGISGKTFKDLPESDVLDLVLELFTIYNISEDDIVKRGLNTTSGGFYTFDISNKKFYLKLPDLSGKDSFGFVPNIFEDRNFYLEVQKDSALQRVKLEDISIPPSIDFAGDFPDEFPEENGSLDITVESNKELVEGFLSVIIPSEVNLSGISGIRTSSDGIEIYTAPLLTQPVIPGRSATFDVNKDFGEFYYLSTRNYLGDIYSLEQTVGNLVTKGNINKVGLANGRDVRFSKGDIENFTISQNTYFGEKNRPEVLLLENSRQRPRKSNNRKYWSNKIVEARPLFANARPKIYHSDQIPELWLSTRDISEDNDGNTIFTFPSSELEKLNKKNISNISFVFYAKDLEGQLARAPGVITLEIGSPTIEESDPNGFADSNEISPFDSARITFRGSNLTAIQKLRFISNAGQVITFEKGNDEDASVVVSSDSVFFNTYKSLQELGFTSTTTYTVLGETELGKVSSTSEIYISDGAGGQIAKQPQRPDFSSDDILFFTNKEKTSAGDIPIILGQNSILKVKSKKPYFNGDYSVFAYLASENKDSLLHVEIPSNLLDVSNLFISESQSLNLTVATSIEYEFSKLLAGQDFYKISSKKAGLKIPGQQFENRNFSALTNLNHNFYIIFTPQPIQEIITDEGSLNDEDYFVLQLGDVNGAGNQKAFIPPPNIIGIAAIKKGASSVVSNFTIGDNYEIIYDTFGATPGSAVVGNITAFDKLSDLAIVFFGDGDTNGNKRYDFFIGKNKINNKLSGKIEQIGDTNQYVAFFKNVNIKDTGDLSVYITKKNKNYNVSSSSETVNRRATFALFGEDIEYDRESQELIVNNKIDGISQESSGLIVNSGISTENIINQLFPATGSGIALTSAGQTINFIQDVDLTSNFDVTVSSNDKELKLLKNIKKTDISSLAKSTLYIPAGTRIPSSSVVIDNEEGTSEASAFLTLEVLNPHSISFNKPRILGLKKGNQVVSANDDPSIVRIEGGEDYSILVETSEKRFSLIFDDVFIVKPKDVKQVGENQFRAKFKAPKKLIGSDCPEIAASISNAGRNAAKFQLGDNFVVDIQKKMLGLIDGINKVKIPDLDDLKELIENFPLRFINISLDKVSIPTDLINSFCDMSFHLTADLKIALNGFQILMVPIQVIFCIIDVICALLNPFKVAKAVIRLFQCLYDLILLLPQISVPVMFIQLILHLLKLLECVFDKVLTIITVINEIINAIQLATEDVEGALWNALKSLEETLSEYLLDLKVSLSVLDPIVSILAIFLQLLGLAFRFPCSITDEQDEFFCMDGSMLGGLIIGKALKDDESYKFESLIPVGQAYSEKTLEEAATDGTSDPLVDPADGDLCAVQTTTSTYLDSMNVDSSSLRSTYASSGGDFNLTFSVSATKSRKGFGSPGIVEFQFKEKGRNGFFNKKKIIDPDQTLDGAIYLTKSSNNQLTIETGSGKNLISPIDGAKFLDISGDSASVKPLELEIEVPITEIDEETGETVVVGTETIPRTFNNIPKMAILDEEFNVYFVEPDGFKIKDGYINSIRAKIVNINAAEKKKFLREDVEIDTDGDDEEDDEAPVYDFPQLYFFDMREVAEDIETKCGLDFFNNDLLEDDPDDIAEIVEEGQDCIGEYQTYISDLIAGIRDSMIAGKIPSLINIDEVTSKGQKLEACLEGVVDKICIYVVNSLNTQFKILEDSDTTPLEDFPSAAISEELSDGFEINGPALTGAREYAAGIGDSAEIRVGQAATIEIIPRDSYDNIIPGDISDKIVLEIISDTTTSASFIETDGNRVTLDGDSYIAKITASDPGIVKVRAKICNKTVQAVTYAEVSQSISENTSNNTEVDCVPEATNAEDNTTSGALGALTKIDRILTIYFVRGSTVALAGVSGDEEGSVAKSDPQAFGSKLEN